ncbi:MAG: FAD-dependent oxidoreductase, partial [Polyangiaceae bacterium]
MRVVVVGAGIIGATSALELAGRGHAVTLLDAGAIPHPDASSTDISKVVRLDYGDDDFYVGLMERALPMWRAYQDRSDEPLFHETGFALLTRRPLEAGGFEEASYRTLTSRGHALERLDGGAVTARLPAWRAGYFVDGYLNRQGGWAEGGRVVRWLAERAAAEGVDVVADAPVASLRRTADRVTGVALRSGEALAADVVVVAAGA